MTTALQHAEPLVAEYEGCKLVTYVCPAGVNTIGYGHTGKAAAPGARITQQRALELLRGDLAVAQRAVRKHLKVPVSSPQEAALISFVFNLGEGAYRGSTLLRRLNTGDYAAVPAQLLRWNKAKTVAGKLTELRGLTRRRVAEGDLWRRAA